MSTRISKVKGGLYRCYLTNAVRLSQRLSVGVNIGMVLGTVTQSETQENATIELPPPEGPALRVGNVQGIGRRERHI